MCFCCPNMDQIAAVSNEPVQVTSPKTMHAVAARIQTLRNTHPMSNLISITLKFERVHCCAPPTNAWVQITHARDRNLPARIIGLWNQTPLEGITLEAEGSNLYAYRQPLKN